MIEASFAIMHKMRPAQEQVEMTEVTGRVRGKIAIVGDDVSMTGGTLIAGAKALREHGAKEVNVFVTHALFSDEALEQLGDRESGIDAHRRHRHGADERASSSRRT